MNHHPLISVIVPIYRIEAYLAACVESIFKQTYTNLEIILIDDGSPDNCGAMCDQYARMDTRIRVIHQENRGLSAARNSGLEIATGEYIGFIDSDDYVSPHFYERLWEGMQAHPEARIIGCQYYYDNAGITYKNKPRLDIKVPTLYSYNHFCEDALLGYTSVAVWNKLYEASLLQEIRFREGQIAEDRFFFYDFSFIAKHHQSYFLSLPDYLYYYRIRPGSICCGQKPFLIDLIQCFEEIAESCKKENPEFYIKLQERIHRNALMLKGELQGKELWKKKYSSKINAYVNQIKIKDIWRYDLPIMSRCALSVIKLFPYTYSLLYTIREKCTLLYASIR